MQAFLDAVDQRLNGNSLLLAHRLTPDLAQAGVSHALATMLHQPGFWPAMLAADRLRGSNLGWSPQSGLGPGALLRPGARLDLTVLPTPRLKDRLAWMLAVGGDWYGLCPRLNDQQVAEYLEGLISALAPYASDWSWVQARPNFLHSTGYFDYQADGPPPDTAPYFDGGNCDGALAGLGGDVLVLLLSNGSP